MELIERVELEKPHIAEDIILELTDNELKRAEQFSSSVSWVQSSSVNVFDVCGTLHPDYCNKSWLNLLQNGKRMKENLRLLNENTGYYCETKYKSQMAYIKIDDKIYIGRDGNHSTCIAKFLFFFEGITTIHGVTVEEYNIDDAFEAAYGQLHHIIERYNLPWRAEVCRNIVSRSDTAGWKRDTIELSAFIRNYKSGYETQLSSEQILYLISESENPFKRFIGQFKELWRS